MRNLSKDVDPNGTVQYSTNKTNSSLEEVKRPKRDFWKSIASYDLKKGGRGGGSRGGGRGKRRGKGGGGGGGRRSTGCRKQNNAALILIPSMQNTQLLNTIAKEPCIPAENLPHESS
ncbi:uncharacterized protein [Drosophila takahashii]|uniref:uncharacterized protein isoform X2 n=1 Tax=Drosophila takahashii TaxID=29030 RepID=UPI003898FD62